MDTGGEIKKVVERDVTVAQLNENAQEHTKNVRKKICAYKWNSKVGKIMIENPQSKCHSR